jgi:hypothetical protein
MPNYANGKVYSIRSFQRPDLVYIGSTTQSLSRRLAKHRTEYKSYKKGKYNKTTSFDIFDVCDDSYIELVEIVACGSKEELHRREGHWVRNTVCVNRCIPGRTPYEYRQDNADKIAAYKQDHKVETAAYKRNYRQAHKLRDAEYKKKYEQVNKEKIAQRKTQQITCMCGSTIARGYKAHHLRTQKHHQQYQTVIHDFIHS